MATKIKVKKITDLEQVTAAGSATDTGVVSSDMILVAHGTNHNEQNQVIYHTNSMTIDELLSYMRTKLANDFMSKEDGDSLSTAVDKRLKDAEETMAKSDTADTFFSKIYADDSGKCSLNSDAVPGAGNLSTLYTSEYIFNCDSKAYCHFVSQAIASLNATTYKDLLAHAILQVNTENGWKTVCIEPIQKPDLAFDIDLHGYFYGGTKIRAGIQVDGATAANVTKVFTQIDKKYSCLYISRTSDKDPFPVSSFTWWTNNQQTLSSNMADQPNQITADGFVSFSGKYYSGQKPNKINFFGGKPAGSTVNVISAPYVMDTVYGIAERSVNGTRTSHRLGSTEHNDMCPKNMAQVDDFSGKYYYISASPADPVSVYMTTDYKFDDSKNRYSIIGGNVNPTQVKFTEFGEISAVTGKDNAANVPPLTGLIDRFDNSSATDYKGYHQFAYAGGIPMYSTAAKVFVAASMPYVGTDQRNTAYLAVNMPAGQEGCYMRERQKLDAGGSKDTYSLMPYVLEGQTSKTIIRDDSPNRAVQFSETSLSVDVLNGSVSEVGVGVNPYATNYIIKESKNDTYANVIKFVTNDISNGWTLTAVNFIDVPDGSNLAVKNFAFAACPRLSAVEFKKNMSMYGRYTFAAPDKMIKYAVMDMNAVSVSNGVADNQSMLSSVKFNETVNGGTHVEEGVLYGTFANCVHLQSVNLSCTDATALSDNVFINCKRLKEVAFPSACVTLGQDTFNGCSSLTAITFDSGLTSFTGKAAFTKASNALIAKNAFSAKYTDNYMYSLHRMGGNPPEYYVAIQLTGAPADYYQADNSADTDKIFGEISACVTILQKNGLGCTTASTYNAKTDKWSPGAGRRYYIKASDGTNIRSTSTSNSELIYNTIGTADKAGVESVKKLMAIDDMVSTPEHCNPLC